MKLTVKYHRIKVKVIQVLRSSVAQNSMWIIGEQVFQMIMSLIIGVISARYLGASKYGALNYTASFVTFFTSVASLGMDGVIIKKMIDDPEKEGEYLGSGVLFRAVASLLSSVSIVLLVWILNIDDTSKVMLAIIQSIQLMFISVNLLDSWFQRHLNSKYVSIAKIISCIVVSTYKMYLLVTGKNLYWFAFSNTLNSIVVAVLLLLSYVKNHGQRLRYNFQSGTLILKDSYHFIISGLMVAVYGQMDRIMLGSLVSDVAVGYYTTAAVICSAWTFVPNAIISSFRPKIMEIKKMKYDKKYIVRLKQLYSMIIWMCILASTVICVYGNKIVLSLYDEDFQGAIEPLRILIWCETFAIIGNARGIWILCENKNRFVKYYLGMGACLNLLLNLVLIPIMKENGAALATLITQVFTSIVAPLFFRETRMHSLLVLDAFLFRWGNLH